MSSTNNDNDIDIDNNDYLSFVNSIGNILVNWRIYKRTFTQNSFKDDIIFDLAISQKQLGECRGNQIPSVFFASSTAEWCEDCQDYNIHEDLSCKLVEDTQSWLKFRVEVLPKKFEYLFIPK